MKYIFIFLLMFTLSLKMLAQSCDIYTTGFTPAPKEIVSGQYHDLVFSIKNDAKGVDCSYKERSVQVILFLPETDLFFEKVVYPMNGKGEYFEWVYDVENKSLIGLNHKAIGDGQGEENIKVRVRVGEIKSPLVRKTVGLSIVQHHEGAIFPSNDQSNDNSILTLNLKSNVSQQQVQLDVTNSGCNIMDIMYAVGNTKNVDHYEIKRTLDGKTFKKVGAWPVSSRNENGMLVMSDTDGLEDGKTYMYHLVGIRANGSSETLLTGSVLNDCTLRRSEINVFPNPAVDKVYIRLTGELKNKPVDVVFTNIHGENVKTVKGVTNEQNEITLEGLFSGVYFIGIQGNESINKKRIVKIDY